jgi:hypothetical protein
VFEEITFFCKLLAFEDNKILLFIAELLGMIFSMFLCCAIKRIEDMKA